MKKLFVLLSLLLAAHTANAQYPLDSVLRQLDIAIENSEKYTQQRESRIKSLKEKLQQAKSHERSYNIAMNLYNEYKSYVCDSAILYLNQCIQLSQRLGNNNRLYENQLKLTFLMASTGMYLEAVDMLSEIKRDKLPEYLIKDFYNTQLHVYGEVAHYTQNREIALQYRKIANDFKDSLLRYLPENDELLLSLQETNFLYNGNLAEARKINDARLSKIKTDSSEYALIAWQRALICQSEGDTEGGKYYLALSAISDIKSATKDHASLWMLAQILYKEEDNVSRTYNYIRFSWSETVFYNARLRNLQSAVILARIDETYQAKIEKQKSSIQIYLILISALLVLLIAALIYIYRQMNRLAVARKKLQSVNKQLQSLNEELKEVNNRLQSTNLELQESDQIKAVYIGYFIKLCSTYIEKLDEFRCLVNRRIDRGETAELLRYTRSPDALDRVFRELYANFDKAFLCIFPDFVKKVNDLLCPGDKLKPKRYERLNSELRILALIRLGIYDSSQIADFLRYSVNTIYNYRVKIKNRAISRDDFEEKVRKIK
jgi:chaperonin cofactor prefoldin